MLESSGKLRPVQPCASSAFRRLSAHAAVTRAERVSGDKFVAVPDGGMPVGKPNLEFGPV